MIRKKKQIKKIIVNNLKYVITTLIAFIGLAISIITLALNKSESKEQFMPYINLGSTKNEVRFEKNMNIEHLLFIPQKSDFGDLKIINLGKGIAKNLKFTWHEENSKEFFALIKYLDKENIFNIIYKYPILTVNAPGSYGVITILKKNYLKNIDYILPEDKSKSEYVLYIPYEYKNYLNVLCYLCAYYNYDEQKIFKNINLYIDLEYENIKNEKYKKNITINFSVESRKYNNNFYYDINLINDL